MGKYCLEFIDYRSIEIAFSASFWQAMIEFCECCGSIVHGNELYVKYSGQETCGNKICEDL